MGVKINLYLVCLAFVTQSEFRVVRSGPLESFRNGKPLVHLLLPAATSFPGIIDSSGTADIVSSHFLDVEHEETSFDPAPPNITLNTKADINEHWTIHRTNLDKWFEYYNNTQDINESAAAKNSTCAHVIVALKNQLPAVDGIWVACQDPLNPEECHSNGNEPCHPHFNYDDSRGTGNGSKFRTVKIHLSVLGFGIVRLTNGLIGRDAKDANQDPIPTCFDFSRRQDPFSRCEFIKITGPVNEFTIVQSAYDGYINKEFKLFSVQLIARFKNDVALVDVIKATGLLLCDGDAVCTTVEPGPTRSEPTTPNPTTTPSVTTALPTTQSTICQIPERSSKILKSRTEMASLISSQTLNTNKDAEKGSSWKISSFHPRFLEYYNDFDSIWDQGNNMTASCADVMIEENLGDLRDDTQGLWISCQASEQSEQEENNTELDISSFILYTGSNIFLVSIIVNFYLIGNAAIRLHVGNQCYDYSDTEISASPCQFLRIRQDEVFWRGFFWINGNPYEMVTEFKLEVIPRGMGDVIIIDNVTVQYMACENGDCLQPSTTTGVSKVVTYMSDLATSTDNACEESSTILLTTTDTEVTTMGTEWTTTDTEVTTTDTEVTTTGTEVTTTGTEVTTTDTEVTTTGTEVTTTGTEVTTTDTEVTTTGTEVTTTGTEVTTTGTEVTISTTNGSNSTEIASTDTEALTSPATNATPTTERAGSSTLAPPPSCATLSTLHSNLVIGTIVIFNFIPMVSPQG